MAHFGRAFSWRRDCLC